MVILKGWGRYHGANEDVWNLKQYKDSEPSGWGISYVKTDKNSPVIHLKNTVNGKKWELKGDGELILASN